VIKNERRVKKKGRDMQCNVRYVIGLTNIFVRTELFLVFQVTVVNVYHFSKH